MSLFFNSITWPWKTRLMLRLHPEYWVLYCEKPSPHVFRLGMYSSESLLTPVFRNKRSIDAYLSEQCPYPLYMDYKPISVAGAQARGMGIETPCAMVVPDKRRMPRYVKDTMADLKDIQKAAEARGVKF